MGAVHAGVRQQYGYGSISRTPPAPEPSGSERKNEEFVQSLSANARMAYDRAMVDMSDMDHPGRCAEDARAAVYQENNWQEDPAFADLYAVFEAWIFEMLEDPRMTEAATAWSACMAEAGYDVATPDDAQMSTSNGEITPESDQQEIATAVADLTCQLETDYQTSMLAAQHAMEQEFVDLHREQLEALVDAHALEQD
ncbi:hypothetical protein [uncultured Cellulomonas sp.]|uniref:hypothetical protein n=1 Tax=uncultured Cellulomonas sp. TaxID=189682 RepID=UPI0028E8D698|nr:hypothetical protein [uncultured Cellulomonas sp.]